MRHNERFGRSGSISHAATSSLLSGGGGWLALPYDKQEAQQAMPPRLEQEVSVVERPRFLDTVREYLDGSVAEQMQDRTIDYKVGRQNLAWSLTNPAAASAIQAAISSGYDSATYLTEQQQAFIEYLKEFDLTGRAALEFQGCMAKQKSGSGGGQKKNDMAAFAECVTGTDFVSTKKTFDQEPSGQNVFKPQDAYRIGDGARASGGQQRAGEQASNRQIGFAPSIGALGGLIGGSAGAFGGGQSNTLVDYAFGDHILGNSGTGNQRQALQELRQEIRDILGDIKYTSEQLQVSSRKGEHVPPRKQPSEWIPELHLENYKALFKVMEEYCKFRKQNTVNGRANVKPLEKVSFWAAINGGSGGESGVNIDEKVMARLHAGRWAFTPVLGDMLFELFQRQTLDKDLKCEDLSPPSAFPKDIATALAAVGGGTAGGAFQQQQSYKDYLRAYVTYADLITKAQIYSKFAHLESMMVHFAVDPHDRAALTREVYSAMGVPDGAGILLARETQIARLTEFAAALSQALQTRVGISALLPENDNQFNRWASDAVNVNDAPGGNN
jgi:hypothetical protein